VIGLFPVTILLAAIALAFSQVICLLILRGEISTGANSQYGVTGADALIVG
jgi:hypothetical protein